MRLRRSLPLPYAGGVTCLHDTTSPLAPGALFQRPWQTTNKEFGPVTLPAIDTDLPMAVPARKSADRLGARFGRLYVTALPLDMDPKTSQPQLPHIMREVSCSCGNEAFQRFKTKADLENRRAMSCGCLSTEKRPPVGARFGKLTLVGKAKGQPGVSVFDCECGKRCRADLKLVRALEVGGCPDCMRRGDPGTDGVVWDRMFFDQRSIAEHARLRHCKPMEALKGILVENNAAKPRPGSA